MPHQTLPGGPTPDQRPRGSQEALRPLLSPLDVDQNFLQKNACHSLQLETKSR